MNSSDRYVFTVEQLSCVFDDFTSFFTQTCVVGAHKNRLIEAVLIDIHKIVVNEEMTKTVFEIE